MVRRKRCSKNIFLPVISRFVEINVLHPISELRTTWESPKAFALAYSTRDSSLLSHDGVVSISVSVLLNYQCQYYLLISISTTQSSVLVPLAHQYQHHSIISISTTHSSVSLLLTHQYQYHSLISISTTQSSVSVSLNHQY